MRACYFTSSVFIFLTTSLILGLSAPVAAQDGETDRIRIHIFASDESSSNPIDLNLPAGEWEFAPLAFAEEGSQYSYSSRQVLTRSNNLLKDSSEQTRDGNLCKLSKQSKKLTLCWKLWPQKSEEPLKATTSFDPEKLKEQYQVLCEKTLSSHAW